MTETIMDGGGRGYSAKVNSQNQILTHSTTVSEEHYTNINHQDSYNILFSMVTSAGKCMLYVKNTDSANYSMAFKVITLYSSSSLKLTIKIAETGTPVNGNSITPANLNAGSNRQARGTFQVGPNISGLSGGREVMIIQVSNTASNVYRFEQDIVLPQNTTLCIYTDTDGVNIHGFIGFYHDHGID